LIHAVKISFIKCDSEFNGLTGGVDSGIKKLFSGECSFYRSAAIINNVCEFFFILLLKLEFLEQ